MPRNDFLKTYKEYANVYHEKPNLWNVLKLNKHRNFSATELRDRGDIAIAKKHALKMLLTEIVEFIDKELLASSEWARRVKSSTCKLLKPRD